MASLQIHFIINISGHVSGHRIRIFWASIKCPWCLCDALQHLRSNKQPICAASKTSSEYHENHNRRCSNSDDIKCIYLFRFVTLRRMWIGVMIGYWGEIYTQVLYWSIPKICAIRNGRDLISLGFWLGNWIGS